MFVKKHMYSLCVAGRPCKECSCFDSTYALRGCTRGGHDITPNIREGQPNCAHCVRDQAGRSNVHQQMRTSRRDKNHKNLKKKIPLAKLISLYVAFEKLIEDVAAAESRG